jgi:hypothetical protein
MIEKWEVKCKCGQSHIFLMQELNTKKFLPKLWVCTACGRTVQIISMVEKPAADIKYETAKPFTLADIQRVYEECKDETAKPGKEVPAAQIPVPLTFDDWINIGLFCFGEDRVKVTGHPYPSKTAQEAVREPEPMDFSAALLAMKAGKKVRRDKHTWQSCRKLQIRSGGIIDFVGEMEEEGYEASQDDLLATDWIIVP